MARRIYLHIGPPKTGTTFLQAAWFQHRRELADQGVLYPGERQVDQFRAAAVALGKTGIIDRMTPAQRASWGTLTSAVGEWHGDAIVSDEHYALASASKARTILEELGGLGDELHVVVTARDLARQVPAAWQQSIKHGNDETFDHYWRTLAADPARGFWHAQNLPSVLDRWTQGIAPERVHVVVHGGPGSPRNLLWDRMCQVTGVDPSVLRPVKQANESLGVVHIELLRRVNAALPPHRDHLDMSRFTKGFVTTEVLVRSGKPLGLALPDETRVWARERGAAMVDLLRGREYDVVGDLADLLPAETPPTGRTPDSVSDSEVAALAAEAFAHLMVHTHEAQQTRQELQRENRGLREQLSRAGQHAAGGPARLPRRVAGRARRVVRAARARISQTS